METSTSTEIKKLLYKKSRRLFSFLSLFILYLNSTLAQPVWVPTTPSLGTVGPLTIPINYGIDRVGTVYIVILNYNNPNNYSSGTIKAEATNAPYAQKVFQAAIPVAAGDINKVLQIIADVVNSNTTHTVYVAAEGPVGVFVAVNAVRLVTTTLPCPAIVISTGIIQPVICITKNPVATVFYNIPVPALSGILKGTQWVLNWGDGSYSSPNPYISTGFNDVPPLSWFEHPYNTTSDCNYLVTLSLKNPCGEVAGGSYVAIVHGRDIINDGDGRLVIVNNAGGPSPIQVCAGVQTTVTIRDNSIWNCQNPTVFGALPAKPNLDPRNIEWLYGRDLAGLPINTITGLVAIGGGLGNAPATSGRISPVPYGPSSLSQTITIPNTCKDGEMFRVYLKNWNKCNWLDPEYISTYIDILVTAPPAPGVGTTTFCVGSVSPTITATGTGGTIKWYSDPSLAPAFLLSTGPNFTHGKTTAGFYTYYVNETSAAGCVGPATTVVLTINPLLPVSVSVAASATTICPGTSVTFTATPTNGGAAPVYQWRLNGANVGSNSSTYTNNTLANADKITCVLTSNATCPTGNPATSNQITMTVNPNLPVSVSIAASANPSCAGNSVTFTATPTNGGATPSYQWKRNGVNVGINSNTYSYIPTTGHVITCVLTSSITPCATGNPATSNAITMTVNANIPVSVSIAASATTICAGTSVTFTATPVNGGTTPAYQWKLNGANVGANSPTYTTAGLANSDVVTCVLTSNVTPCPTGNPATSNAITMTVNPNLPASVTIAASANPVCTGTSVTFTATPVNGGTTPTYQWYRGAVAVGVNSPTYTYTPANGDAIRVVMTSNATPCLTGSPATSNTVTMTVDPILAVSVSIAASPNPVCIGNSVTFTAAPVNGGTTPLYQWYRGATPVGTNSATYTYTPANGDVITVVMTSTACTAGLPVTSNAITMIVNPLPVVTFPGTLTAQCVSSTTYALSGGNPAGGTYSGPGVVGTNFNASVAGTGTHTITYTYTNANGCTSSATNTIVVNALPVVTFPGTLTAQCVSSTTYALSGGNPAGGTYSGPGVVGTNFNASVAGTGTKTITYTYTNANGCTSSATNTIVVNALPVVTFPGTLTAQCVSSTTYALSGGSPAGGAYSGPGVVGTNFNASVAGTGTHTITYTYTNANGCTNTATNTIVVNALPVVTFPGTLTAQCVSSTTYALSGGIPAGGTYSGPGVVGTNFNASVAGTGTHTITYTYTNANGCTSSATNSIVVNALPVVTFPGTLTAQCVSSTTYALSGGNPAGGTYSGPGVVGTNFNASVAGTGTKTITYTYTNANGCTSSATNTIVVNALPVVTFPGTLTAQCVSSTTYALSGGSPAGGAYSGPGVVGTNFNASVAGTGTHTITYTYTNANGCTNTATNTIVVNALPVVTFPGTLTAQCVSSTTYALSGGNPAGGTYSGPGVVGTNFNASVAGTGTHTITYTYTNANGCTSSATNTIVVNALPVVTFPGVLTAQCVSSTTYALSGGNPAGGTYSGPGVVGTNFNASVAGTGTKTITYTYTNANGCTSSATNTIVVNALPVVTFPGVLTAQCVSSTTYALSGGSPAGGTYSGPGVVGTNFNASVAGTGTHTITYSYTNVNGCTNTATNTIVVNALPVVTFPGTLTAQCVSSTTYALSGGSPAGGTYSGPGVVGTNFNASVAGTGTHTITYTYTNANGCTSTATNTIVVNALPVVTFPGVLTAQCVSSTTYALSGGNPAGGTYSGPGVVGTNFNASVAGTGTKTITYTYTNGNGCTSTATNTIVVNPIPAAAAGVNKTICLNTSTTIGAAAVGGSTYSWASNPLGYSSTLANPTVTPLVTTTYTVTETITATGCTNSNNVVVTVVPLPATSDIGGGGKTAMCRGTNGQFYSVDLHAGSTYNWTVPLGTTKAGGGNAADNFVVLNFPNSGTYTLTVQEFTSAPIVCGGPLKTLTITVYDPPTADAGPARTICEGASVAIGGTPTAIGGSNTFTYLWVPSTGLDDATAANPVASPNTTRTYTLYVTDVVSGCAPVIRTVLVTVNPVPVAYNVTGPDYYCFGTGGITLTQSGSQLGVNYQLYNGAVPSGLVKAGTGGGLTWAGLLTGTYTVRATNPTTLCTNNMNGSVTVAENPQMTISNVVLVPPSCNSFSDGVISIIASGGTGALSYSVDNGVTFQTSNTFGGLPAATYNIVVKDSRNCTVAAVRVMTQPAQMTITSLTVVTPLACFGNTNASARVVAAGGTFPPYTYQWYFDSGLTNAIGGQTNDLLTGRGAGTYWVKVTDFNGCWISGSILISQPPAITATAAITSNYSGSHISCNGAADARITVTASGGTSTLTYFLIEAPANVSGAATGIFTGVAPGIYTVRVTDVNSCNVVTLPVTVTQPAAVAGSALVTSNYNGSQISCIGASDGRITVTASGGTGALSYFLNEIPGNITGSITGIFTGLPAGPYTVRVRDLNLCTINTVQVTITAPAAVTATAAITSNYNGSEVSCFGSSDGRITVTASGGTGALAYLLVQSPGNTTGAASGIFTGVPAGTYTVRVTDLNGCNVTTLPVTIDNPPAIAAPIAITSNYNGSPISCFGASDGIIRVTGTGGTGALTYVLDQNPANVSGLNSGIFTGLPAGTYTVTVRDLNGCTKTTLFVTLNNPTPVTAIAMVTSNYNGSQVSCTGASDGSIKATASGGTGALSYLLVESALNVTGAVTGIFTGVPAGTYTVRVRDLNLCTEITAPVTITNPLPVTATTAITSSYNGRDISCFGASDGRITVTASGGTGALTYLLVEVPLNVTGLNSGIFSGLPAGTYTVRVTDKNGCNVTTAPVTLVNPPVITANAAVTSNYNGSELSCNGSSDGIITVLANGGTGALSYTIVQLPGNLTGAATGSFTGIPAGTYTVRVTDINGCNVTTLPVTVDNPPAITANGSVTSNFSGQHVRCAGSSDGVIEVTAAGGTGALTYVLDQNPLNTTGALNGIFTGLNAGSYTITVTDINGCKKTTPLITIINPPALTAVAVVTSNYNGSQVSCNGSSDGILTVTSTGGTGTKNYVLVGFPLNVTGASTGVFTGLTAGTYTVTVTDVNGCNITTPPVTVSQPAVLTATATVTSDYFGSQITCSGSSDGRITVTSGGGTGTRSYVLVGLPLNTTGAVTGVFTGLPAGSFNFRITDVNGCNVLIGPVTITPPPPVTVIVTVTSNYNGRDISCFGASDGQARAVAGGGTSLYFYQWFSDPGMTIPIGQITPDAFSLSAGDYFVKVLDINGCSVTGSVILTQPVALDASIVTQTNVTCYAAATGSVTVAADPLTGTAPYQYSINGGLTWQSGVFNGLAAVNYTVLVKDINGCIKPVPVTITQPAQLTATVNTVTNVSCNGGNDGSVTVTATAGTGTAPYSYSLTGGAPWQVGSGTFPGLTAGSYTITIRDANNCTIAIPVTITEPLVLAMTKTADVLLNCYADNNGTGTFFVSGGTLNYSFAPPLVNTAGATFAVAGFNSQTFFNAHAGVVTVEVTDAKGCKATATITFTEPPELTPGSVSANQVICYGSNPAALNEVTAAAGGPGARNYQWQVSFVAGGPFTNIPGAILSTYTPPVAATSTLFYRRMVTSGTCTPVYSNEIQITVNPLPVATLSGGETICPLGSSILKVTMAVGTGPFTIDIENYPGLTITPYNSGADIVVSPAFTTTYRVLRVRDANGCQVLAPSPSINGTATVTVDLLPSITSFVPSPPVCEFTVATFKVVAGGTNLTYKWYVNEGSGFNEIFDGGSYFGSSTSDLQIFNTVRTMNGFIYHVVVSGCGTNVQSPDATLTVNVAPEITKHPSDATVCLGTNTTMEADATPAGLAWQWFVNKGAGFVPVTPDGNFSGETTNTLVITNALASFNNWIFRARATGVCGVPVFTNFGRLSVINPPAVTLQPLPKTICADGTTTFLANGTGYTGLQWQVSTNGGGIWTDITDDAIYVGSITNQLSILNAPATYNNYRYRLGLVGSCTTVYTNDPSLTVNPNPVVDFFLIDPVRACGGIPVVLNGNPTLGSGSYTQHRWTGDVGPLNNYTTQSPTFNSQISGSYNLNYRVTDSNGCTANDDLVVIVDSPSADFTQAPDNGCTPLTVSFTKDMTGIASFSWDFGDGSPVETVNPNPVHQFINTNATAIDYRNVTLTVVSPGGCTDKFTSLVTVYPKIDATFTSSTNIICSGNSITFTALPGASKYLWDYGDGVSATGSYNSSHLYTNFTTAPVVHQVKLTTISFFNCSDEKTLSITVMPVPLPQFTALPATQIYNPAGNSVAFTNATNPGSWTWLWRFGDGSTSTDKDPVHNYTNVGDYEVVLIVRNANCSDSIKHTVRVTPIPPVADFDPLPSGCQPLSVTINNTSQNLTPGTTYKWDFGDGSISTAKNPSYTWFDPGIYRVELTVTGPGGTSVKSQVINVYASPKAYFEIAPTFVFVNDEQVRCFNLSQGAIAYLWDFGDGDTSKVKEPYHKYLEEGVYDITLWAYSANGCSDKYILSPGVTVEPAGDVIFSTVFTPNKEGPIERTDLPTGGTEVDQFFYPPIREKVLDYKLQIFNRLGVLIFESRDINIPWNGYYKGQLCQQGVYVWYVEGKYANGSPFKKVGDITLLH